METKHIKSKVLFVAVVEEIVYQCSREVGECEMVDSVSGVSCAAPHRAPDPAPTGWRTAH